MSTVAQWVWVVFLSMMPISELRGAIPLALGVYDFNIYLAIPVIVAANFIPAPFILKLLHPVEKFLRQWKLWDDILSRLFRYTQRKTGKSIERWESLALILFVAVPLPVTGAWTGSLAAYLFGLDFKKSLLYIFIGVCIAAGIVTLGTVMGIQLLV